MFLKFFKFVESYLKSNDAPLYHFTSSFVLNEILLSNKITVGYYKNPYLKDFFYFVSLTRNKNFENYRTANLTIIIKWYHMIILFIPRWKNIQNRI